MKHNHEDSTHYIPPAPRPRLRTNSAKARENIRGYIIRGFSPENYDFPRIPKTWEEIAPAILATFRAEKFYSLEYIQHHRIPENLIFKDWAAGLPSILDCCYFYNRSAVEDLATILEETPEESKSYTEEKAENLLTDLIYRELKREEDKNK